MITLESFVLNFLFLSVFLNCSEFKKKIYGKEEKTRKHWAGVPTGIPGTELLDHTAPWASPLTLKAELVFSSFPLVLAAVPPTPGLQVKLLFGGWMVGYTRQKRFLKEELPCLNRGSGGGVGPRIPSAATSALHLREPPGSEHTQCGNP